MADGLSAWRLSFWVLVVMGGAFVVLGAGLALVYQSATALALVIPLSIFMGAQLGAAWLLTHALRRFARVVEEAGAPPPVVLASRDGVASLTWPAWGLSVGGEVHRLHVRRFAAAVDGAILPLRARRSRSGAHVALALLGRSPSVAGTWDGRLPLAVGPEPFFWIPFVGLMVGVPVHLLLDSWAGIAVGVGVGLSGFASLTVSHVTHRRAALAFLRGLVDGGVRVDAPVVVWNGVAPRYFIATSQGPLLLSWFSWFGRDGMHVGGIDSEVLVRRASAYEEGRAWARSAPWTHMETKFSRIFAPAGVS